MPTSHHRLSILSVSEIDDLYGLPRFASPDRDLFSQLKVVAEGVETEEQANLLRLLKCDEFQGYLFSRPVLREDMDLLLRDGKTPTA